MEAFSLVLFGATGDLARLKVLPSVFDLKKRGLLPEKFNLIANGRSDFTDESYRDYVAKIVRDKSKEGVDEKLLKELLDGVYYFQGDLKDKQMYQGLKKHFGELMEKGVECGSRIYHLAILPSLYQDVVNMLGESGLNKSDCGWTRILLEKPFGNDLESAVELDKCLKKWFNEDQVFRIDHYLAKETVQNILYFRFANEIFEPSWNREYVDHIQISLLEEFGIADRGKFYERIGALRDVVQNHLLQVLATATMERPSELKGDKVVDKRKGLLKSLKPLNESELSKFTVSGQYQQFVNEKDVDKESRTETYVATTLPMNNRPRQPKSSLISTNNKISFDQTSPLLFASNRPHHPFKNICGSSRFLNQI